MFERVGCYSCGAKEKQRCALGCPATRRFIEGINKRAEERARENVTKKQKPRKETNDAE